MPVAYMLLYQWTTRHRKNYYLYAGALGLFFSFLLKPALSAFGLFQLNKGAHYYHLFLGYIVIMLISKWITDYFAYLEKGRDPESSAKRKMTLHRWFPAREKAK